MHRPIGTLDLLVARPQRCSKPIANESAQIVFQLTIPLLDPGEGSGSNGRMPALYCSAAVLHRKSKSGYTHDLEKQVHMRPMDAAMSIRQYCIKNVVPGRCLSSMRVGKNGRVTPVMSIKRDPTHARFGGTAQSRKLADELTCEEVR